MVKLRKSLQDGFSLMELLIVIAIIGILVSIAAASYTSAQKKSRDSRRIGDMKSIQNAYEQYYADNSSVYPTNISLLFPTYLPSGVPSDPKPDPYTQYNHTFPGTAGTQYCSCAFLEGTTTGGNATNNTCTFGAGAFFCVTNLQ